MTVSQHAVTPSETAIPVEGSEGEVGIEAALKGVPSLGGLLHLNGQIGANRGQIGKREVRLREYDEARLR